MNCRFCNKPITISGFEDDPGSKGWTHTTMRDAVECPQLWPEPEEHSWTDDHPPRTSDQMAELYKQHQSEALDRAINTYLDSLHSTTWGRMFYITGRFNSRDECVKYIRNVIEQIKSNN